MADNKVLIEKLFRFQEAIRAKNPQLAGMLASFTISFLEFQGMLADLSEQEIAHHFGMGPKTSAYVHRIFQDQEVEAVVRDVPVRSMTRRSRRDGDRSGKDMGNWDGSWDKANRRYEGE